MAWRQRRSAPSSLSRARPGVYGLTTVRLRCRRRRVGRRTSKARNVRSKVANAKMHRLVIVESPAKAKTIAGYLGPGYVVEASYGHVRDLPRNAADVPAKFKALPWARLGVDVDNGFAPLYVVSSDRKQQISRLTKLAKE